MECALKRTGGIKINIELVKLTDKYREQLFEMLTEWKKDIMENHTDMSPWKIWANDFHDFSIIWTILIQRKPLMAGFPIPLCFALTKTEIFLWERLISATV